jgi:hypothetical protein
MAVFMLESLVLRGVAVLSDGPAVNLRRGTGYAGDPRTPEIAFSMRHPSPGCAQDFGQPAMRLNQAEYLRVDESACGAGRSHGRAGVLSRSTAILAGRSVQSGRSGDNGGTKSTTATHLRLTGQVAAFVNEKTSWRLAGTNTNVRGLPATGRLTRAGQSDLRCYAGLAWCKQARKTPPASTWGEGVR